MQQGQEFKIVNNSKPLSIFTLLFSIFVQYVSDNIYSIISLLHCSTGCSTGM